MHRWCYHWVACDLGRQLYTLFFFQGSGLCGAAFSARRHDADYSICTSQCYCCGQGGEEGVREAGGREGGGRMDGGGSRGREGEQQSSLLTFTSSGWRSLQPSLQKPLLHDGRTTETIPLRDSKQVSRLSLSKKPPGTIRPLSLPYQVDCQPQKIVSGGRSNVRLGFSTQSVASNTVFSRVSAHLRISAHPVFF